MLFVVGKKDLFFVNIIVVRLVELVEFLSFGMFFFFYIDVVVYFIFVDSGNYL